MRLDDRVHLRLCVAGLVTFVVAKPAVPDEIEHDIPVELPPVFVRDASGSNTRLGIVAIDVDDRCLDCLGDVGGVVARPGVATGSSEADLVVDHDVDGAAGEVASELAQVECLTNDTLTAESGVSVE